MKIAPQGWKIPDITEWDMLKTYLKDDAATLKTGIWTSNEGTPQANNKTGFNGKPVGIYSKDGEKAIIYGYSQRYAAYWTIKDNQTTPYETSIALSNKLKEVGKNRQVLCVTHLSQIAVMASHHLLIEKKVEGERTSTHVTPLDFEGRVQEIARIMAGDSPSKLMLQSAREALQQAQEAE